MLEFLFAKLRNHTGQFRIIFRFEGIELLPIMLINFGFDRSRAGHRRSRPERRSRRAQRIAGDFPEWLQCRRPNAAIRDHLVKSIQMPLLLFCHMVDCAAMRRVIAHHRELALVDLRRAIFASLIDPDHRSDIGFCLPQLSICHAQLPFVRSPPPAR